MQATSSLTTTSTPNPDTASSSKEKSSRTLRQASVETVADEDDITCRNAGQPKNRNVIIESTDEEDETYSQPTAKAPTTKDNLAKSKQDTCDDNSPKEGLDDEELGES